MESSPNLPESIATQLQLAAVEATPAERNFMQHLAGRQREPNSGETEVEDLERLGAKKHEAVAFFKKLSALGCGVFITGRHGAKSRIAWKPYGAIPVASAFLREATTDNSAREVEPRSVEASASTAVKPAGSDAGEAVALHAHTFLLRPNLTIQIRLPLDLTKEEANRLADFIRAVPF